MSLLFESPSWILSSILIVVLAILVCLALLWVVRKNVSLNVLRKNHDVAGFTFSIIGVLYSVILGFTVISVQGRYNQVMETIHNEAIFLADLYRDAGFFSPKGRDEIRASLRQYVDYVVQEEWWLPVEKKIRFQTQIIMEKIWNSYYSVELQNEKMALWYTESISKLNTFINARLARQFSTWEHLGSMMWSLLLIGGLITIGFMFFFGLENFRSQMLMTALLAGYLSFILYLVYSLDHGFQGPAAIQPVALEQIVNLFDHWDKNPHELVH